MTLLDFKNIHFVPSIHQRMAFADEVLRRAEDLKPDCIAVELPPEISSWVVRGVLRLPQLSAVCLPSLGAEGELHFVPIDPADSLVEAVRYGLENEIDVEWIDAEPSPAKLAAVDLPDDLMIEKVGLEAYAETIEPYLRNQNDSRSRQTMPTLRDRLMAARLIELGKHHKQVLCVLGFGHFFEVRRLTEEYWARCEELNGQDETPPSPARGPFLTHLEIDSIPEILREIPHVAWQREMERGRDHAAPDRDSRLVDQDAPGQGRFDKLEALRNTLKRAERSYRDEYRTTISLTCQRALYQFTRNLALTRGRLQPDTYELILGANGTVDGDYGYEVYKLANSYPEQSEDSDLPTLRVHAGRGSISDGDEKFMMRSAFGDPMTETIRMRFRRRPTVEMKAEWKEEWQASDTRGMCSWPPEDERQERFMMFIRKRALEVIGRDKSQVVEFSTSIMDGLDIRETVRNWHSKKLFVRQTPQPQGRVGGVVVVFEDSRLDSIFSWRCTLYAENANESDISFYATPLGDKVVGPRISRTEFGGILSIYPSLGIPDIWQFPLAKQVKTCADVLLLAAIVFSPDRFIAYVAGRPPSSMMRGMAARAGKHIIYMPLTSLPRAQVKRIRNFHILSGRDVRRYAADYIFED